MEAEMGTGKTTFILALLRAMGIENPEGSPTYSLVNSYESPMYGKVFHFDLYRIQDEEEAYDIGIEEMLYENSAYCFIEWAENIKNLLPLNTVFVSMTINENGERIIKIDQFLPFVMNTQEEIREAMHDYGKTQFGGWPWAETEVVHQKEKGRFALHADGREEIK